MAHLMDGEANKAYEKTMDMDATHGRLYFEERKKKKN